MSDQITITPSTLTFEHIQGWDGPTMRRQMKASPEMRDAIYRIAAEQVTKAKSSEIVETPPASVETVPPIEAVQAESVAPVVELIVAPVEPKKIVVDYQVRDEAGNPIGRPTHLEAATEEEMRTKLITAHEQATRAFHRLKAQKVQSLKDVQQRTPETAVVPSQLSDADLINAIKELRSEDPVKALEAHRRLTKAETDKVAAEKQVELDKINELRRQEQVSFKFLSDHKHDFNNCEANIKLIKEYFEENQLPWTSDNLEVAFHALESELAPVAVQVVPAAQSANPTSATPTATPTAVVAAPQPTVTVSVTPSANPTPAQPRPGVNGSLIPGQQSAVRPVHKPKGLTMDDIKSWDGPTMRAKMRNPQLRAEIIRVVEEAKLVRR